MVALDLDLVGDLALGLCVDPSMDVTTKIVGACLAALITAGTRPRTFPPGVIKLLVSASIGTPIWVLAKLGHPGFFPKSAMWWIPLILPPAWEIEFPHWLLVGTPV